MRPLVFLTAVLALGCESSTDDTPDYASNFAGIWTGDLTETDTKTGVALGSGTTEVYFEYLARNVLKLANACNENSGPVVTSTSATEFSGNMPYSCRPVADEDCSAVVLTWKSLSGTLNGSVLSFKTSATVAGCSESEDVTLTFTNGVGEGTPPTASTFSPPRPRP